MNNRLLSPFLYDDCQGEKEEISRHSTIVDIHRLRSYTHAINATHRFQITRSELPGDLQVQPKQLVVHSTTNTIRPLRNAVCVINATLRFQNLRIRPLDDLLVDPKQLAQLVREHSLESLECLGGVKGVARLLKIDLQKGLDGDAEQLERHARLFGTNTYQKAPKGFFFIFSQAWKNLMIFILMLCALIVIGLGIESHTDDELVFGFATSILTLVTVITNYQQALRFASLNQRNNNIQVQVIRGGKREEVCGAKLVVGDIVLLSIGDEVPADGLFVDGFPLTVKGEDAIVRHVDNQRPFLLSGSKVEHGRGSMLVTQVGMTVAAEDIYQKTPLQVRMEGVAAVTGKVGLCVAVLVFVILLVFDSGDTNRIKQIKPHQSKANDAVGTLVAAMPLGLPLVVSLNLANAMKKMADKVHLSRLSACETMGCATVICSDKTGTLTQNQMTVTRVYAAGEYTKAHEELESRLQKDSYNLLLEGISQNTNGDVSGVGKPIKVLGSATEKAILSWGHEIGMKFHDLRSLSTTLQIQTVESRTGVAVRVAENGKVHAHWKGPAEQILCASDMICEQDSIVPITPAQREHLMNVIEEMSSQMLQCIAFGYREVDASDLPTTEGVKDWRFPDSHLTLIAIVGIKDPIKPGISEAVKQCKAAGLKVYLVTEDSLPTTKAIATNCGMLQAEGKAIEGVTFRDYPPEIRKQELQNIEVLACSTTADMLLMVQTLKNCGETVAVIGHDALAFKEADIGLAMGNQVTLAALESSHMIILDDNFASVMEVVKRGRCVHGTVHKFIQFHLTANMAALIINISAVVTSGEVPLSAIQVLWVNLFIDTLGALALAIDEPPFDELVQQGPVKSSKPLISNVMWRNILVQAFYQAAVLLLLQFHGTDILRLKGTNVDHLKHLNNAVMFNIFFLCQLFNLVKAREENVFWGLFKDWSFLGIIGSAFIVHMIAVELLSKFISTVKLDWQYWLLSIIISLMGWPIAIVLNFIEVQIIMLWEGHP